MRERLRVLQIHLRRPPRPPCPQSHHPGCWRLAPTKLRESAGTGTSPLQITRVTICAEAFLVKMMDTTHRAPRAESLARVNGTCHPRSRPTTLSRYLQSSLHPRALLFIVRTHAGSSAESAIHPTYSIPSRPYHHPFYVSVRYQIRIEYTCKAPAHIFLKRSSRRTCRNNPSEV